MKTKSLFNRKVQLAFGTAILALLFVGAISFRGIAASTESDRWVRHTHEVLENLQSSLSAMQDVESSYRGFVVTGNEQSLKSYGASIIRSQQEETIIRNLTEDNPEQQQPIATLHSLADQIIQYANAVIELRRTKGLAAAADSVRAGEGLRIMDEFRDVIRKMQDEELHLLGIRDADAKWRLGRAKAVLILGTVLGLFIATAAGWSVQRDSSRRGIAEEALLEGEERFRTLANNISQLAWMADEHGCIFWYNDRWFDYTGTTIEEMAGWGWKKVHHPDQVQRVVDKISKCFQTGEVWEDTFPLRDRHGNYRIFLSRAVPIRSPQGKVMRWFGTNTDISESMESEAKYRGLLEAAPDAIVVVNQNGEIVLLNLQAEKQFGYSRDELIGQKVKNIIPEGFAERLISDGTRSAAEALAQQIGMGIELSGRRKDGSEFPIEIMLSPLKSGQGTLVTAAIRDISVRRDAENVKRLNIDLERRVIERTTELAAANKELEAFVYSIAHDLRAPLRHIDGFSNLLAEYLDASLDEDARHYLESIQGSARDMGLMVDDLLNLSRVARQELNMQVTGLNSLVEEVMKDLKPETKGREIEWKIAGLPFVECDSNLVKQVFVNLLSNAVKFTRTRQRAIIEVDQTNVDGQSVINVRDNGVGFSMKYSDKLFGVFQRLHRQEDFEGTGVGLATVQRIVQKHGGRIWAEAELNAGATFCFTLGTQIPSAEMKGSAV
jgi:PAS domain S-box-containing protein